MRSPASLVHSGACPDDVRRLTGLTCRNPRNAASSSQRMSGQHRQGYVGTCILRSRRIVLLDDVANRPLFACIASQQPAMAASEPEPAQAARRANQPNPSGDHGNAAQGSGCTGVIYSFDPSESRASMCGRSQPAARGRELPLHSREFFVRQLSAHSERSIRPTRERKADIRMGLASALFDQCGRRYHRVDNKVNAIDHWRDGATLWCC
jgi:hypothetical protein